MKKNIMMRIASVLMIAVLLTTCVISGTFAKYTAEATADATATIAKWSFTVGSDNIPVTEEFDFDLFATIKDTDEDNTDPENNELDVAGAKIAPGTQGSFAIILNNTSDVNAQFKLNFTVPQQLSMLTFTYKVDGADYAPDTFVSIDRGTTETVTVNWVWAFDALNNTDNTTGLAAAATVGEYQHNVTAAILVEQVD